MIYFYLGWEDKPKIEDLFSENDILWKLAIQSDLEDKEVSKITKDIQLKTFYKNYMKEIEAIIEEYAIKSTYKIAQKILGEVVFKLARPGIIEQYKIILRNDIGTSYLRFAEKVKECIDEVYKNDYATRHAPIDMLISDAQLHIEQDIMHSFWCGLIKLFHIIHRDVEKVIGGQCYVLLEEYLLAIKHQRENFLCY